jgi:hypothetical protein
MKGSTAEAGEASLRRASPSAIAVVLFMAALAVTYVHARTVDVPHYEARRSLHESILAGTAGSPYAYRLLVPTVTEPPFRLLASVVPERPAFLLAYIVLTFVATWLLLSLAYRLFADWHTQIVSLVGVLLLAVLLPVTLFDQQYQPWSLPEAALLAGALLAVARGRWTVLAPLTVVACLNRETGIFLPLAAWIARPQDSPASGTGKSHPIDRFRGPLLCLLGLGVLAAVRWIVGPREHVVETLRLIQFNLTGEWMLRTLVTWGVFAGGVAYLAIRGYQTAPRFFRRAVWIVPFYVAGVLLFGVWYEVRLLIPTLPILVGLALGDGGMGARR